MPKFIIEREIAGAGNLSKDELQAVSQKSCGVLCELGTQIQWLESYVTDDKIYCDLYRARRRNCARTRPARRLSGKSRFADKNRY